MITQREDQAARQRASQVLIDSRLAIRPQELESIEVADFGLSELETTGAQILTLVNTGRIVVKLLVLFPAQTLPEHTHVRVGDYPGKEETLRCERGVLYLYVPGQPTPAPACQPPAQRRATYTVWHEVILRPGEQITLAPNTPHWFQGGPQGALVWSLTTTAFDGKDVFTDPEVVRQTVVRD